MGHSEETRRKMSEAQKGAKNHRFGKHDSEEHKRKISESIKRTIARRGHWSKGKPPWNKGLKGYLAGSKNPKWKGGISRGYKTGYYSAEYKEWRMAVFIRDEFRCQGCGKIGTYLTAHHIKSFAHYPKLRFVLENGVTLCEDCHKLTDNYKGRGRNKRSYN
jgi:hypothetical protein